MKSKVCSKCGDKKSTEEFYSRKRSKDGYRSWCKQCELVIRNEYYKEYPWKLTFYAIKDRCNNPKCQGYRYYGGRGIKCQITLDELKILWFRDKAWALEKPSIDRKNSNKNYTFNNCRFIEHKENTAKTFRKAVNQYDLDGNFIKIWKSQSEIARYFGVSSQVISMVCLGGRKSSCGFIWKLINK